MPEASLEAQSALILAFQTGDHDTFAGLVERHQHELKLHCYRMLASFDDAEDLLQETLLRAWNKRASFEGRSTPRAWLYRIATNACLDFLERQRRTPTQRAAGLPAEITWLQPYPDRLLDQLASAEQEPEQVVIERETIELVFLCAIQHLPPRQRAILLLRDVLGWSAEQTADQLETSVAAVKSALQRARTSLKALLPSERHSWQPTQQALSQSETDLLQGYMRVHEQADLGLLHDLLSAEAFLSMPPLPMFFAGRSSIIEFTASVFDPSSDFYHGQWRCLPTFVNRQPAVAHYVQKRGEQAYAAQVLDVLRIERGKIVEITAFDPRFFAACGLPDRL